MNYSKKKKFNKKKNTTEHWKYNYDYNQTFRNETLDNP